MVLPFVLFMPFVANLLPSGLGNTGARASRDILDSSRAAVPLLTKEE